MTDAARFATKDQAEAAAAKFLYSFATWVGPMVATVEKIPQGWYVGFPLNIRRSYLTQAEK